MSIALWAWAAILSVFQMIVYSLIYPVWGRVIASLFTITDYIVYIWKGYNLVLPIIEWLEK
jgi:hypothetical protein